MKESKITVGGCDVKIITLKDMFIPICFVMNDEVFVADTETQGHQCDEYIIIDSDSLIPSFGAAITDDEPVEAKTKLRPFVEIEKEFREIGLKLNNSTYRLRRMTDNDPYVICKITLYPEEINITRFYFSEV